MLDKPKQSLIIKFFFSGKLEVTFNLECELKNGEIVFTELTYHLLQDERKARAHGRQRVRRALTLKPPFFKLPLYVVNVKVNLLLLLLLF